MRIKAEIFISSRLTRQAKKYSIEIFLFGRGSATRLFFIPNRDFFFLSLSYFENFLPKIVSEKMSNANEDGKIFFVQIYAGEALCCVLCLIIILQYVASRK